MSVDEPLPFFIVGHPRSGSTLLATILSRHSDIAIPPETHYLDKTFDTCRRLPQDRHSVIRMLQRNVRLQDLKLPLESVLGSLPQGELSHAAIFGGLLRAYADARQKSRVGEKTPAHLPYAEILLEWFPGCRIICLVRDARDTVRSLLNVPWTHDNARRHAAHWAWCARRMKSLRAQYPESISLLRYEDLLAAPADSLQNLCDFIGAEFEQSMLDDGQMASAIPEWEQPWKSDAAGSLDPDRRFRWLRDDGDPVYPIVDDIARAELAALDYPELPPRRRRRRRLATVPEAIWYSRWNYAFVYQYLARWLRRVWPKAGYRERQERR